MQRNAVENQREKSGERVLFAMNTDLLCLDSPEDDSKRKAVIIHDTPARIGFTLLCLREPFFLPIKLRCMIRKTVDDKFENCERCDELVNVAYIHHCTIYKNCKRYAELYDWHRTGGVITCLKNMNKVERKK